MKSIYHIETGIPDDMRTVTDRVNIKYMRSGLSICISALFLFSCQPQGNGILGSAAPVKDIVDQATKGAPFAYDVAIDTISYNSCISETVKGSNIHGIKMGASEGGTDAITNAIWAGLKLRTDFLQVLGKSFKPDFPSTTITPGQIQRILSQSDYNKDAYIQFAVRRKSDYSALPDLISPGANNTKIYAMNPRDLTVFPQTLYSGVLGYNLTKDVKYTDTGAVLSEGPRLMSLSDVAEPARGLEATFDFNATNDESAPKATSAPGTIENFGYAENYPQAVRDAFNNRTILLAATFGGYENIPDMIPVSGDTTNHINLLKRPYLANSQAPDLTKAFGRGYQLTFDTPNASISSWMKTRLTKVKEIALDSGSEVTDFSWVCENFVIMRQQEWNNNKINDPNWVKNDVPGAMMGASCSPIIATDLTGVNGQLRQTQIKKLRRHYSEDNWNIGLYLPAAPKTGYTLPARATMPVCLSPKSGECYLPTTGILADINRRNMDVGIQYDTNKECYNTATSSNLDTKRELGRCAQFASICTRKR